jgi:hypothetical protein
MAKSASPSYPQPTENVAQKKVLPPSKARAGLMDRDSLYMLIASITCTVIAFAMIFFIYS